MKQNDEHVDLGAEMTTEQLEERIRAMATGELELVERVVRRSDGTRVTRTTWERKDRTE